MTRETLLSRFVEQMDRAGFEVHEYCGRWGYRGPAVTVGSPADFHAALRATSLPVCWDECGKNGYVIYPGGFSGPTPIHPRDAAKLLGKE